MLRGTRRSKAPKDDWDSEDGCYSGEDTMAIEDWFEMDKIAARYCRKTYGKNALGLWELEHEEIHDSNVQVLADRVHEEAAWAKGKAGADKLRH